VSWVHLGIAFALDQARIRLLGMLAADAKIPSGPRKGQPVTEFSRNFGGVLVSLSFIGELLLVLKAVGLW
jgi:hypothetical protein